MMIGILSGPSDLPWLSMEEDVEEGRRCCQ